MRITKKHIIDILENNKNDTIDNVVGCVGLGAILVFLLSSLANIIWIFVVEDPNKSFNAIGQIIGMTALGSLAVALMTGGMSFVIPCFKKRAEKLLNKVLQDNNINTTIDDIEQMSDDQLNALCAEQLFSKYRVLSNDEVIAFNDDVKKYGTRDQMQKWKDYLHYVRETPLGLIRQYMMDEIKTQLQEQKHHHNTPVKNMIDELLAEDMPEIQTDELIVSQNVKRSMK